MDRIRAVVYGFNAGVYKCGYAETLDAYARALDETFGSLDACEALLTSRTYLAGSVITEADVCAFPTLVRFDVAYYTAFRCNRRRLRDYPNLSSYVRRLYSIPAFRNSVTLHTYPCVHFIEARWEGRLVGNAVRALEAAVDVALGAAVPGASWWRVAAARILTLPARTLSAIFR